MQHRLNNIQQNNVETVLSPKLLSYITPETFLNHAWLSSEVAFSGGEESMNSPRELRYLLGCRKAILRYTRVDATFRVHNSMIDRIVYNTGGP